MSCACEGHCATAALLADSLDDLGDALTHGLSPYAVSCGPATKTRVALFKGGLILAAALGVAAQIVHRLRVPARPCSRSWASSACWGLPPTACASGCSRGTATRTSTYESGVGVLAQRHGRQCLGFVAAGGMALTGAAWPDLLVALELTVLLQRSSLRMIASAREELRAAR